VNKKIFQSSLLSIPEVHHGFLSRHFGKNQKEGVLSSPGLTGGSTLNLAQVLQVHGKKVYPLQKEEDLKVSQKVEADAMVTSLKKVALVIRTADCVPLLFYDPNQKVVAAAHAGWRGTSKNISSETIRAMVELYACNAKDIMVAIGPCIQACCYEVDAPVVEAICRSGDRSDLSPLFEKVKDKQERWKLDLASVNQYQLIQTGVAEKKIWMSPNCTACQGKDFYSYRKEGEAAGRQWSYIALV